MSRVSQTRKAILLLTLVTLAVSTASAADLDASINQGSFVAYQDSYLGDGASSEMVITLENFDSLDKSKVNLGFTEVSSLFGNDFDGSVPKENFTVEGNKIIVSPFVQDDAPAGTQEIGLDVSYENGSEILSTTGEEMNGDSKITLNISEPYSVEVLSDKIPDRVLDFRNLGSMSYKIKVTYRGESKPQHVNDFYGDSADKQNFLVDVEKFVKEEDEVSGDFESYPETDSYVGEAWFRSKLLENEGNGIYRIEIEDQPTLEIGEYMFHIYLKPESNSDKYNIVDQRVYKKMEFSGAVKDVNRRGVATKITLTDDGVSRKIEAGQDGLYSEYLLPGIYDSLEIDFFGRGEGNPATTKVIASDVQMSNEGGNIRYDYWGNPENIDIEGLKPVNMMAVEFGYSLKEPQASMKYDSANVNYNKVKVFECTHWNFEGKECFSEWEKIDADAVDVNPITSMTNFPVTPHELQDSGSNSGKILKNAYIIGTNSDLSLSGGIKVAGPDNGRVPVGKDVRISGYVIDEKDDAVEAADVQLEFMMAGTVEKTLEGTTDAEGHFTIEGSAPEEPGNYSVAVEVSKTPYNSFEKKYENSFETYYKEGIALDAEREVEVTPGTQKDIPVEVKNIGQKQVEDVKLSLTGMNSDYYGLSESFIESIDAGETRTFTVNLELPEDYCGSSGCSSYPSFTVKGTATVSDGSKETAEQEVQTVINYQADPSESESDTDQKSSTTDETNDEESSFSTEKIERMTGEFLATQSSLNIALGLIMLFTMVLAGAVKKKKNEGGSRNGRQDGSRPAVQKPAVAPSGDTQVHQPEPVDNVDDTIDEVSEQVSNDDVDETIDAIAAAETAEDSVEEDEADEEVEEPVEEDSKFSCSVCGEGFDTESARKLHEQAMH